MTRRFTVKVLETLADENLSVREKGAGDAIAAGGTSSKISIISTPNKKEWDCVVCSDSKRNGCKRSRTMCNQCQRQKEVFMAPVLLSIGTRRQNSNKRICSMHSVSFWSLFM